MSQERYDPREAEPRWVEAWLDSGLLRADPDAPGAAFTIAIPPPNVTGALHMGHALNNTIQDVLIRAHRMAGDNVKWICGTDHAGIATQAVVEKALAREGLTRRDIGREAFLERVWAFKEESEGTIISQLQRLGATLDYSRERFTMDEGYAAAVLRVFVDMYEKGYIYRDRYMVNWDPGLGSAISDLEVEDREVTDRMVQIAYPLADGEGEIVVATVRPETMLGDTAVAVNPGDDRYRHLIGSACVLPLVGRELPIIGDDYADPAFGTGALKVTPAHDPNDFELSRRHGLERISVIGEDGRMTDAVPDRYRGLTAADAAERVLADLRELGAVRREEPYTHSVPFSHRSGARVEPLISLQWFADMTELARPAIAAVEDGRVRFTGRWAEVYLRWMGEIRPWCLSRQLWWGHQLPVWYRGEEIHVGTAPPEGEGWERDPDVLDTWFSSALWPFATLGWPDRDDPELSRYYPGDVLSTARDIIFLWVARMVMMGMEYMDDVPFSDVYVHPVIQAPDGRRMSKSLGTGIDPVELIDQYGADALRFGLLMMSSTQDVRFSDERIRQGRQLVTKLWNATRLVIDRGGRAGGPTPVPETLADRWMVSRVAEAVEQAQAQLATFNFSALADLLYHLIFDELADWYLELLKAGEATPEVAGPLLEQVLALAHPVIPFVTEESWARLPGAEGMMLIHAPAAAPGPRDQAAEAEMARFQELVSALRSLKNARGLTRRDTLTLALDGVPADWADGLSGLVGAELGPVDEGSAQIVPLSFGRALVGAAGVDAGAERLRLEEALRHAESELARAERQLANARFVERAPAELVTAEREKRRRFATEREELTRELAELADGASARRPT